MCIRTTQATAALQARIIRYDSREGLAQELGVNSAHVHKLFQRGKLSPTLDAAMVTLGWLEPKPTRTRLAIDCDEATRQWFRDEAARREMSGEAFLLYMREVLGS